MGDVGTANSTTSSLRTGRSQRRKLRGSFPLFQHFRKDASKDLSVNFDPKDLVPVEEQAAVEPQVSPLTPPGKLDLPAAGLREAAAFGAPPGAPMSAAGSASPPSVFDQHGLEHAEHYTEPTTALGSGSDEPSYDLKPPPPSVSHDNVEVLAERFFSVDHLDTILHDPNLAARFTRFVAQYRPQLSSNLASYLETKKAIAAVEYANAVADNIATAAGHPPYIAAMLDERFEARSRRTVEDVVDEALPAYLTHRLVTLVTDTLVKEITGNNAPIMRELIPSLAEVYCVTDPSLPDNPIVYASEEFYNTTQYGRDYVIGRNCRFLQGPKSSNSAVKRMIEALASGQDICETILNYRRDGTPFMNLLLIAPLYDNKGQVRYFLGCQIDVSSLIEAGRGMESFSQLLAQDRTDSRFGGRPGKDAKQALGRLGAVLSEDETNAFRNQSRRYSEESREGASSITSKSYRGRRILGMENNGSERALWPHPNLGPSGRLPGVYQNYLLVRPFPSLRITFTSPALRIPGLLQTKFMDRIGGPQHVREGILDALSHGTGVTAKISWITSGSSVPDRQSTASMEGKPRWIHCTPLLGSDDRVGVWMVVMVENEEVTGQLNRHNNADVNGLGSPVQFGAGGQGYTSSKLYAEYMKREGRPGTAGEASYNTSSSAGERREVNDQFKDF